MIDAFKPFLKDTGGKLMIYEAGCGMPIADEIMSASGASNVVEFAMSMYSKESQKTLFGESYDRSVSKEFVEVVFKQFLESSPENVAVVTTCQTGAESDHHGYIGISGGSMGYGIIIHFTLGYSYHDGKKDVRNLIKDIIKEALFWHSEECFGLPLSPASHCIDGIFTKFSSDDSYSLNAAFLPVNHTPFVIENGEWKRMTESFRGLDAVSIVKGSFNPFHDGHKELFELHGPVYKVFASLTTDTLEGKVSSIDVIISRAKLLPYPCIIDSNCVYYKSLIANIKKSTPTIKEWHLPMGIDVYSKFNPLETEGTIAHVLYRAVNLGHSRFYKGENSDVSSTKIRENNETDIQSPRG